MPGKAGQARVLSVLRNSTEILGALQPASEHQSTLLNFQSVYCLSSRPHLNIKCLTEPGDQGTQPAVSQLPASRLQNASFLFPKSCRGVCQRLPRQTSTEEKRLLMHSTYHQNHSLEAPALPFQEGRRVWPCKPQRATTSSQLKNITENEERSLRSGAQMIQSLEMRPYKKA